jgi:hypothetical protein
MRAALAPNRLPADAIIHRPPAIEVRRAPEISAAHYRAHAPTLHFDRHPEDRLQFHRTIGGRVQRRGYGCGALGQGTVAEPKDKVSLTLLAGLAGGRWHGPESGFGFEPISCI